MTTDPRAAIVQWANWCVPNKAAFRYLESRPFPLFLPSAANPIYDDCSATSVLCCWLAKAPEPFPGAYQGIGNTESFLTLEHVPDPVGADFVVYGEGLPLGDQHMAVVVGSGSNPMTMSHGDSAEPRFVNAIEGCPPAAQGIITYVRAYPLTPPPPPPPPIITEDIIMVWSPNTGGNGDWLISGDKKAGIPNPDALAAVKAQGIPQKTLTAVELATLATVKWGSL